MSTTRSIASAPGPFVLMVCVLLSACGQQNAPPAAAPPAAAEAETSSAALAESDRADRPRGCASSGSVALAADAIGDGNSLHRQGEPHVLRILSVRGGSTVWQTDCAVPLSLPEPQSSPECRAEAVLPRPSTLSLKRVGNTDSYELTLQPAAGSDVPPIKRLMQPVWAAAGERKHVAWLMGEADDTLKVDLFVYLRDTRADGGVAGARPHKNYVVEAFMVGEDHCDAHRPHLSICRSNDFPEGKACSSELSALQEGQYGLMQTDTGTGNEPPRR